MQAHITALDAFLLISRPWLSIDCWVETQERRESVAAPFGLENARVVLRLRALRSIAMTFGGCDNKWGVGGVGRGPRIMAGEGSWLERSQDRDWITDKQTVPCAAAELSFF